MACNCLCCGCTNCAEGDQGPCCCGGSSGTCCDVGETCCSGVCKDGECGCCCIDGEPDETKTTRAACREASGYWHYGVLCDPNPCDVGCCCIDGEPDYTNTTQAACESAGGTWNGVRPCAGCSSAEYAVVTVEFTGSECSSSGQFQTTVPVNTIPACGDASRVGIRIPVCGYNNDYRDLTGVWACDTTDFDANGNCIVSDCDWTDHQTSWANIGLPTCDCDIVLVSYEVI